MLKSRYRLLNNMIDSDSNSVSFPWELWNKLARKAREGFSNYCGSTCRRLEDLVSFVNGFKLCYRSAIHNLSKKAITSDYISILKGHQRFEPAGCRS